MRGSSPSPIAEPGSFRDPGSGVLRVGQRVWRYFDARAAGDFDALVAAGVLDRLIANGRVLPYAELGQPELSEIRPVFPLAMRAIEQPLLPFVSYSYEWTFDMLKDAAILHLDVVEELLKSGFILKDGTSDNIQFVGGRPVFIDVGSIERYVEGRVWAGYSQFCRTFLNPLLLQVATGLPFQRWLRGCPDGLAPDDLYRLLSWPARLRRGAFVHVTLQTWLNKFFASAPDSGLTDTKDSPVSQRALLRQVTSLRRTIESLRSGRSRSSWENYNPSDSYLDEARRAKTAFIKSRFSTAPPRIVWDFGCNIGEYSLLAAQYAELVVAIDADPAVANGLYLRTRAVHPNVLPLVMDVTSPSPDQGWAQAERYGLQRRGPADLILWLALLHHVALTRSVPPDRQVAWIAKLTNRVIIEFVPANDPMASLLLRWRPDRAADGRYTSESLEMALRRHFTRLEAARLPDSDRILYAASKAGGE